VDDKGYGDALWHGSICMIRRGLQRVISALELFHRGAAARIGCAGCAIAAGTAYQAVGLFDKAD